MRKVSNDSLYTAPGQRPQVGLVTPVPWRLDRIVGDNASSQRVLAGQACRPACRQGSP
jgi:hypothetical protein